MSVQKIQAFILALIVVSGLAVSLMRAPAFAGEFEADRISDRVQRFHMVYGFVSETRFTAPDSEEILRTEGMGDSAIWTGTLLAAEAYRYAVTRSPVALQYIRRTIESIRGLATIRGDGLLARSIFPMNSPFYDYFSGVENWLGLYQADYKGVPSVWLGHPTRDQYAGVFLGLAAAHDLVDDEQVRADCRELITSLIEGLQKNKWMMTNPGSRRILETYVYRPDQLIAILQLGKHVNPRKFARSFNRNRRLWGWLIGIPPKVEARNSVSSYFKFNLDFAYFYLLVGLERDPQLRRSFIKKYEILPRVTRPHMNALFNMYDYALRGADEARDQETRDSLEGLLERGFRSRYVDLRDRYPACAENISCVPIPVRERTYADFLWQRAPFELLYQGDGSLESPGIDYLLPYWMARYYGVFTK